MITINIPANWTEAEQILNQLNCNKTIVELVEMVCVEKVIHEKVTIVAIYK